MAIPQFLEFAQAQTRQQAPQISPAGSVVGGLEELVRAKQEKEQQAARQQLMSAQLEEQQLKSEKERQLIAKQRQDMEHARLLAPYQRDLLKAQVEKQKVPLEELSQMNYYKKQAEQEGDKETSKLLQGMMHNYASSHHLQGDARQIQGLMSLKEDLEAKGQTDRAAEIENVIKEKITPPGKELGELSKEEAKNFGEYEKKATDDARTAVGTIKEIENIKKHYDETGWLFKGGRVAPTTKIGAALRKQGPAYSDHFYEMTKGIGRLQQLDLQKLKTGGRMTVAQQQLVAASTLDPSLGKAGMQRMTTELTGVAEQLKEKGKFIQEAKEKGITDSLALNNSWNRYMEENPAYSITDGKGILNRENLSKSTWEKYLPGAEKVVPEKYTEDEIDFAARKRGITREEVIRKLKAAGKM